MNQKGEKIYYLQAITDAVTVIGGMSIMPKSPPVPFDEQKFKFNEQKILHYEESGIIMVSRPGTKESARAARDIKEDIKQKDEVFAGGSEPLPPTVRQLNPVAPEPEEPAEIPTFSAPSDKEEEEDDDDDRCVAVTGSGNRCKLEAMPVVLVCKTHLRMLKNGKEVKDYEGNSIADNGLSIEA